MNDLLPGIGHNQPSDFDALKGRVEELHAAANKWALSVEHIADEAQAARCADFLDQIRAAEKSLTDGYKAETRPLADARNAIKNRYDLQTIVLGTIKGLLTPKQTEWLQRVRRAKEAEAAARAAEARKLEEAAEAERKKAEAGRTRDPVGTAVRAKTLADNAAAAREEARQAAMSAERPRIAGEYGRRSHGLRTRWLAEIEDLPVCFVHYMDRSEVWELLTRLACADARGGERDIPGCRVFSEESSA